MKSCVSTTSVKLLLSSTITADASSSSHFTLEQRRILAKRKKTIPNLEIAIADPSYRSDPQGFREREESKRSIKSLFEALTRVGNACHFVCYYYKHNSQQWEHLMVDWHVAHLSWKYMIGRWIWIGRWKLSLTRQVNAAKKKRNKGSFWKSPRQPSPLSPRTEVQFYGQIKFNPISIEIVEDFLRFVQN